MSIRKFVEMSSELEKLSKKLTDRAPQGPDCKECDGGETVVFGNIPVRLHKKECPHFIAKRIRDIALQLIAL